MYVANTGPDAAPVATYTSLLQCFVLLAFFWALPATAAEKDQLLVWINGDKGYAGIERIVGLGKQVHLLSVFCSRLNYI